MRIVKFAYNDTSDLKALEAIVKDYQDIEIKAYNENVYKEKRKAYLLKSKYGAKLLPFLVLENTVNTNFIRVFYQESGDVLTNFSNYLKNIKKKNLSFFIPFINKCKEMNIPLEDIHKFIDKNYLSKIYNNKL